MGPKVKFKAGLKLLPFVLLGGVEVEEVGEKCLLRMCKNYELEKKAIISIAVILGRLLFDPAA
jgi:hypothetical protein